MNYNDDKILIVFKKQEGKKNEMTLEEFLNLLIDIEVQNEKSRRLYL